MQDVGEQKDHSRLFLLLLTSVSVLSFLPAAIDFLHGDDVWQHLAWNYGFLEDLRSGSFYPRWLASVNGGEGSPVFVFYGPLFSYVTAAFSWKLGVLHG